VKFWQRIIDKFYDKYKGLQKWHSNLVREVVRTGQLVMPTGRVYEYERNSYGDWPRTTILNYPVQGLGADLMAIARVSLYRRLKPKNLRTKLVCTVHDSIVLDSPSEEVEEVIQIIRGVWQDIPRNFYKVFGVEWTLPTNVDIKVGPDWGTMTKV
jgi:DNA polymerase-1